MQPTFEPASESKVCSRLALIIRAMTGAAAVTACYLLATSAATAQTPAPRPAVAAPVKPQPAKPAKADPFEPYTETVPGTKITFELLPVQGGKFQMGSPAKEKGRGKDEAPQHEVEVRPFWMEKFEVTWDMYHLFLDIGVKNTLSGGGDSGPDALTYPTPPYADETFGYGKGKQPNIAVTWHAAMEFARWIAAKTGKPYRLPTEAEWEYACRAGTQTAYSFGDSPAKLGDHAFFAANAKKHPNPTGQKKANPWGLFDMHGNVAEWVIDAYDPGFYSKASATKVGELPVNLPGDRRYSHVARGGGWKDKAPALRCAARKFSEKWWSKQDPQSPQSIWWHTEATDVGFRLVRPVEEYPGLQGLKSKMTMDSSY